MKQARLLIIMCILTLAGAMPAGTGAAGPGEVPATGPVAAGSADELFLTAARAFAQSDDAATAEAMLAAARLDGKCLAILWDERFTKWLPPEACSAVVGVKPFDPRGDPGPCALYRLGWIRKNWVRERDGDQAARKAGRYFLVRTIEEFPGSPWAGEAALLLIEDGGCATDAGYPDCRMMTIRAYEDWLNQFAGSWNRAKAVRRLAEQYLALADQLESPEPWGSKLKAELCRGRALELAGRLDDEKAGPEDVLWARDFIKGIRASGKPWSVMPLGAVSENRRMRRAEKDGLDYNFLETGMKVDE